ncbi:hypothetical protein [Ammoniphilus sp. CFH 90114]|uniref:hypothetical protein n=1 Tax=Ammoniphilus sp. CFH 90114 TaxID=2493665 RepID=UPI00100FD3A9|nr:hypothetical protein [Ammoniphilus sp. CFH 90114]RXT14695.1 hypothetical protein EIZ39_00305 [Ammoniphilus sp. CFH 90114]
MLIDINLLPQKEKKSFSYVLSLLVAILILLAVGGWVYLQHSQLKRELQVSQQQLELARNLRVIQEQKTSQEAVPSSSLLLEEKVKWLGAIPISTVNILNHLVQLLPERGFFLQYQYSAEGELSITVQFDTLREVSGYVSELRASKNLESVEISNIATSPVTLPSYLEGDQEASKQYMPRYIAQFRLKLNQEADLTEKGEDAP